MSAIAHRAADHGNFCHRVQFVSLLAAMLLVLNVGCKKDSTPAAQVAGGSQPQAAGAGSSTTKSTAGQNGSPSNANSTSAHSADQVLQNMVKVYRQAEAYRDQAEVRVSYVVAGSRHEDSAPLSVTFERPHQLRMEAYRTLVVSDGKMLHARITDESTGNIDNQIVERSAPPQLHLQDIYGDALLSQVIGSGLARYPVQLELLLDEKPLTSALAADAQRKLLSPESIEGQLCDRVEVNSAEGAFVFWIDQQNRLLRRLQYPTDQLQPDSQSAGNVNDLALIIEFHNAQFTVKPSNDTYAFHMPEQAKRVRYFVPPPQELPTNLFGKQPANFSLKTLSGQTVSSTSLQGKTVAMVWFNNHEAGKASLLALNQVAQQFQGNDKLAFYGVCTEPAKVSDLQLENLMRRWKVELPIMRDLAAVGRDVFSVPVWPTMVVLDPQGRVQLFEVGHIDPVYEALPSVLRDIAQGENLAEKIVASHRTELADYEQQLATAAGDSDSTVVEIPTVQIAPRSQPQTYQLQESWSNKEIASPGNMLLVPGKGSDSTHLMVLSENRKVVQLDLAGNVMAEHDLEIPPNAGVQHLQTQVDGQSNRYYVAWANLGKQLFLFDSQWQRMASYPNLEQEHEGIRDCTLGDLNGDGTLAAYVAFWGAAGVHEVSLAGKRRWTNRAASTPMTLTVGAANAADHRQLWITTATGDLLPLNPYGREGVPQTIGSHAVHDLARSPLSEIETPYCAFSLSAEGSSSVIAVDGDFVERWSYELPAGAHRNALRPVACGTLLPGSQADWIFAGADGSVHLIAADGSASDFFYFGKQITGLEATRDESRLLLVASAQGVSAMRLSEK